MTCCPPRWSDHTENRDDVLPGEEYDDATWDAPAPVLQMYFNNCPPLGSDLFTR